jgi:hypothetical protein
MKKIDSELELNFQKKHQELTSYPDLKETLKQYQKLRESSQGIAIPFDPKFNSMHWAFDVWQLINQILYSICWMDTYAAYYKKHIEEESEAAHVNFHASYYSDNAITRIDSCRDKLSLMVWSYYVPFNPEKKQEILDYPQIVERLRCPLKFCLKIEEHEKFLNSLQNLSDKNFSSLEQYRHTKIHRREPRIEIYGVKSHHDWPYMFLLSSEKEIKEWEKKYSKKYSDDAWRYRDLRKDSTINGYLFDQRNVTGRLWGYNDLTKAINETFIKLVVSAGECYKILRNKQPFKKN